MIHALTFGFTWLDFMLPAALRAIAMLLLTWTVVLILRKQSAHLRSLVWTVGLVAGLLTPLMFYQPVGFDIGIPLASLVQSSPDQQQEASLPQALIAPPREPRANRPQQSLAEPVADKAPGAPQHPPAYMQKAVPSKLPGATEDSSPTPASAEWIAGILGLVWLSGTVFLAMRFAAGLCRQALRSQRLETIDRGPWFNDARRIARELDLWRSVRLVRGEPGSSPQTWGVLDPTISIPSDDDLPDYQSRQAILRHELAHIARFDALRLIAERLLIALFWWNPLVWLAERWAHLDREQACDDTVLLRGARPSVYANQLLERPAIGITAAAA